MIPTQNGLTSVVLDVVHEAAVEDAQPFAQLTVDAIETALFVGRRVYPRTTFLLRSKFHFAFRTLQHSSHFLNFNQKKNNIFDQFSFKKWFVVFMFFFKFFFNVFKIFTKKKKNFDQFSFKKRFVVFISSYVFFYY